MVQVVELRASYRYVKEHPWVVQAMTGFLSAYFMEKPEFRVQQHFVELESGMHVWVCEIPPNMTSTAPRQSPLSHKLFGGVWLTFFRENVPDPVGHRGPLYFSAFSFPV